MTVDNTVIIQQKKICNVTSRLKYDSITSYTLRKWPGTTLLSARQVVREGTTDI